MNSRRVLGTAAAIVGLAVSGIGMASPAQASEARTPTTTVNAAFVDGYRELVNDHADKCADVSGNSTRAGALVHEWDCANDNNQLWAPGNLGNGFMQLQNRNSGYCMGVRGNADVEGARIEQQPCDATNPGQWWRWLAADGFGDLWLGSGFVGECFALSPNTSKNGTSIVIGNCSTTTAKFWHFE